MLTTIDDLSVDNTASSSLKKQAGSFNDLTGGYVIKSDKRNIVLVTDYQFISVLLSIYDNSPVRFWYEYHGYPTKENKYHAKYKNFFIEKLKNNQIEIIYTIRPLYGDKNVLKDILDKDCLIKEIHTEILDSNTITKCESLNN